MSEYNDNYEIWDYVNDDPVYIGTVERVVSPSTGNLLKSSNYPGICGR